MTTTYRPEAPRIWGIGSLDGPGTGDHDLPYRFGRPPTSHVPYPLSKGQLARLLVLRCRIERRALAELFAYYRRNEAVLTYMLRDAPGMFEHLQVESPQILGDSLQLPGRWASALAAGRKARRPGRGVLLRAALNLAMDFDTWRVLTGAQGLTDAQAVDLMSRLVESAGGSD
jgi:hypothetical protein